MKLSVQRVYLDLDRTLMDTARLMNVFFATCEKLYGLSATRLQHEQKNFFYNAGDLKTYSLFEHLATYGVGLNQVRDDLRAALAGQNFLFDDVPALLQVLKDRQLEVHVLTFGKTDYQTFKFSLAPELKQLPLTIVFEQKDIYLAQQSTLPTLLVDDKLVQPLPSWCTQVLLDRTAPHAITSEGVQLLRINSLNAVETLLTVGYNEPNQKGTSQ